VIQDAPSPESIASPEVLLTKPKPKLNPRILVLIGAMLAVSYFGWQHFKNQPPANLLHISGRIEAEETDIGVKTGGRVATILVREGDKVKSGQVVAEIEDLEVNEQLQAATAQLIASQQAVAQAKLDIEVAESRIQESTANLEQAKGDSRGRVSQANSIVWAAKAQLTQAQAQVGAAQAQIQQAAAEWRLAVKDRDRYSLLVREGAVNRQLFEQAQTKADTAKATLDNARAGLAVSIAAVKTAEEQLAASQGSFIQTQSTQLNPAIRSSQLAALRQQKQQAYAKLAAAQAQVKSAVANQQQIQKRLESFKIKSPIDGVVQSRPIEPGAVVATGKTLLTVIAPTSLYLRAYVPEGNQSAIHIGQPARVLLDSDPQQPQQAKVLQGKISEIDPQASFTPENIYFKKDRVRQVVGIKITIDQDRDYAKPGMPADAEIDVKNVN
jgi:HlyD family secretion protein